MWLTNWQRISPSFSWKSSFSVSWRWHSTQQKCSGCHVRPTAITHFCKRHDNKILFNNCQCFSYWITFIANKFAVVEVIVQQTGKSNLCYTWWIQNLYRCKKSNVQDWSSAGFTFWRKHEMIVALTVRLKIAFKVVARTQRLAAFDARKMLRMP